MTKRTVWTFLAFATTTAAVWNVASGFIGSERLLSTTKIVGKASRTITATTNSASAVVMLLTPAEQQQAAAMSDYLVKAHQEKLSAVQEAEAKKQAEIDELKQELEELKSSQSPSSGLVSTGSGGEDFSSFTKEDLVSKLLSYQQFMSEYIINAQQQKLLAVKAAEEATSKKYQDLLLTGTKSDAAGTSTTEMKEPLVATATMTPENKLYFERNAKIAEAAKAGKSRWGDAEILRAQQQTAAAAVSATSMVSETGVTEKAPTIPVPPEVKAADHGLRNDGGVGGPTLAERVALGAGAGSAAPGAAAAVQVPPPMLSPTEILFHQRNAMVAAAAKAGKSRWGDMEIKKAEELASKALIGSTSVAVASSPSVAVPREVAEADRGLSSSGGIPGPGLAERVNLGAALLGKK